MQRPPARAHFLSAVLMAALLIGCQREVVESGPTVGHGGPRAVRVDLGPLPDGRIAPPHTAAEDAVAPPERDPADDHADRRLYPNANPRGRAPDSDPAEPTDHDAEAPAEPGPEHEAAARRLPFIDIDFEQRHADLEGYVALTEGLLELVATIRAGKEHESVFAVRARPQHIHLALLMLGLEPGEPGRWIYGEDDVRAIDPTGDRVKLSVLYEREGETVEKPVSVFVRDQETGDPLPGDEFVFAGSAMGETFEGEPYYLADGSGDVISLVSFGIELLAWPAAASHSDAVLVWEANTPEIPELGAPVVIRLRPAEGPDEQEAATADDDRGDADQPREDERPSEDGAE